MTTSVTRTDFRQLRTVRTLADFARRFPAWPYVWFRGLLFSTVYFGPAETPSYRVSESLSDRGLIVCRDAAGALFRTRVDRDLAALAEAARTAPDDSTLAAGRAFLESRRNRASQSGKNGRDGVQTPEAPENRQERHPRTIPGRSGHVSKAAPLSAARSAPVVVGFDPDGGRRSHPGG